MTSSRVPQNKGQTMENLQEKGLLTLRVMQKTQPPQIVECDSIRLVAKDDANKKGGGSLGIRKGHVDALIALDKGKVCALLKGSEVFLMEIGGGVAHVSRDVVTIFAE